MTPKFEQKSRTLQMDVHTPLKANTKAIWRTIGWNHRVKEPIEWKLQTEEVDMSSFIQ